MGMSHQRADATLNLALRNGATPHLWLHTGNPGAAGTANVAQIAAANIVRKPITFNAPENHPTNVERRVLSAAAVVWLGTEITATQNITHISIWSAASGGVPEFINAVTVAKIVGSDGVTIDPATVEAAIGVHVKP